jgi:hypothetical protein
MTRSSSQRPKLGSRSVSAILPGENPAESSSSPVVPGGKLSPIVRSSSGSAGGFDKSYQQSGGDNKIPLPDLDRPVYSTDLRSTPVAAL